MTGRPQLGEVIPPRNSFVLVSFERSGTHLLRTSLNSHPSLHCIFEPFNEYAFGASHRGLSAEQVMSSWSECCAAPRHGFSIHWNTHGRLGRQWSEIWPILRARTDLPIIELTRDNMVEQLVSRDIASRSQQWQTERRDFSSTTTITVEPARLVERLEVLDVERRDLQVFFRHHRRLQITYETLSSDYQGTMAAVFEFLGVEQCHAHTSLIKMGRPLSESIENFEVVSAHLSRTRWAKLVTA